MLIGQLVFRFTVNKYYYPLNRTTREFFSEVYILHCIFQQSLQGSVLYNWFKHGKLERSEGSSITEGIGQGRVTKNLEGAPVDDALCIQDTDAVEMVCIVLIIVQYLF